MLRDYSVLREIFQKRVRPTCIARRNRSEQQKLRVGSGNALDGRGCPFLACPAELRPPPSLMRRATSTQSTKRTTVALAIGVAAG